MAIVEIISSKNLGEGSKGERRMEEVISVRKYAEK